ncbi:MAG TPA: glycosyltransferase family 2 protein [Terriglobia bacterium]|nr:glycosyltransferase family 2 protein [Terriglobia bacterium]
MPTIDFVVPLFNEEDGLLRFHRLLDETALPEGYSRRYIYVNDGSADRTPQILNELAASDSRIHVIHLSRNFGHQAALSAGLDAASADIVISMDGDGQHPAHLIPEMLRLHSAGYDVVQAQRLDDAYSGSLFKRATSSLFYRLVSVVGEVNLSPGTSDFRLLSRQALEALKALPEYHRFLRGMIVWIGFPNVMLPYKPGSRLAGKPKYSLRRMLSLAADGFFSFSLVPLWIGLFLGAAFIALAGIELAYTTYVLLDGRGSQLVPGWTSLVLILTIASAITMILQGILGIYVGMIFKEVKRRPVYLIKK